jgi:hypothetical protein
VRFVLGSLLPSCSCSEGPIKQAKVQRENINLLSDRRSGKHMCHCLYLRLSSGRQMTHARVSLPVVLPRTNEGGIVFPQARVSCLCSVGSDSVTAGL